MEQTVNVINFLTITIYFSTTVGMWFKFIDYCGCYSCDEWPRAYYLALALVLTFAPFVIYDLIKPI